MDELKKLWRWSVVGGAAPFLWGAGIAAMYGDDYKVAICLYFCGIVLLVAKFVTWEEHSNYSSSKKLALLIVTVLLGAVAFVFSLYWITVRKADVRTTQYDAKIAKETRAPSPTPSTTPSSPSAAELAKEDGKLVPQPAPRNIHHVQLSDGVGASDTRKPQKSPPSSFSPQQTASGDNSGQVGGTVTAGPCSNVQIGGNGNRANTNCIEPRDIITLTVKASFTAHLRNPSSPPEDLALVGLNEVSRNGTYFEGRQGKVILDPVPSITYTRDAAKGEAGTIMVYNLPAASPLTGKPIDTLTDYDKLVVLPWGINGKDFDVLLFTEILVLVNGKEVFKEEKEDNFKILLDQIPVVTAHVKIKN